MDFAQIIAEQCLTESQTDPRLEWSFKTLRQIFGRTCIKLRQFPGDRNAYANMK
ncbi:unnamed protein product [Strongylus vulgaris]|uniref:Uncharacterized protein n=1 Tax=Strongylus vulgaris TaxID=40348 RepID=A0A3P7IT25_STRVU|nr:unnamed protein product [Strongylus vulgaris]